MVTVSFDSWQHRQGALQSCYVQQCEKFVNCFKKGIVQCHSSSCVNRLIILKEHVNS